VLLAVTLVYLGEHYVVDLLSGMALALLVNRDEPQLRRTASLRA
jgi:hypothetical protein